ncbi:MAG: hypothetical protein IJH41_04370 [Eubacterium sp.]|nr:hypothetical protein [Eubacterium sp.]
MNEDIVMMLTGWKEIRKHLDHIPHSSFMDLTVCYLTVHDSWEDGKKTGMDLETLVDCDLESRDIRDMDELYKTALLNTERLFPARVQQVSDGMYCITNDQHTFGATAMMYPAQLKEVSRLMGSDMYIVPSSIHEVICIDPDAADPSDIYDFIRYSNREYLAQKDVLSNSLYYYEAPRDRLTIAYSEGSFN